MVRQNERLLSLKELQSYKRKLFCVLHKNRQKQNLRFKLHFVSSNQISTYRKLNLPLTSSIYFIFLPLEMQKRLEQTKVYHTCSYFA